MVLVCSFWRVGAWYNFLVWLWIRQVLSFGYGVVSLLCKGDMEFLAEKTRKRLPVKITNFTGHGEVSLTG